MIFEYDLVVPANTQANNAARLDMQLVKGVVHKLAVQFPAGCRSQVLVVINRAVHQVWPTNPDGQMKGDFFPIEGPVWYELDEAPYKLEAYGWSPGTNFNHTVTIRLWMERKEVLLPGQQAIGIMERLGTLIFGRGK